MKITDRNNRVVIDTIPESFKDKRDDGSINGGFRKSRYRRYLTDFDHGSIDMIVMDDRIIRTNKNFFAFVNAMKTLAETMVAKIDEEVSNVVDDFFHNIIKIHGDERNIIDRCLPKNNGEGLTCKDIVKEIEKHIKSNSGEVAEDLFELSREIDFMDYHFSGYRLMYNKQQESLTVTRHNLKKFLLKIYHRFLNDFADNNVKVNLHDMEDKYYCEFEYETLNVAMHNFFQNAAKYALPNSRISVNVDEEDRLIFDMMSIKIEKGEMNSIKERGVFGVNTPDILKGAGIGMYQIDIALKRNNINFYILPDYSKYVEFEGTPYVKNKFEFTFSKK